MANDSVSLAFSPPTPVTVDLLRASRALYATEAFEGLSREERYAIDLAFGETEREVFLLNDRLAALTKQLLDAEVAAAASTTAASAATGGGTTGASSVRSIIGANYGVPVSGRFVGLFMSATAVATESAVQMAIPDGGTVRKFYAYVGTAPGSAKSWTFTVRKNGVDTTLTCTISGTSTSASDLSNEAVFAPGDLLSIGITSSGSPTATTSGRWLATL